MNAVLGFAPYIAFFLLMRGVSVEVGLWGALTVAIVLTGRDWWRNGSLKILEIGGVVLFAALAGFTTAVHLDWTVMSVRLAVDGGLLAIILTSLATGQPFTLQYAREQVPEQYWQEPRFLAAARHITWVWAVAFTAIVASHALVVHAPAVSVWLDLAVTAVALLAAFRFTAWYAARARRRASPVPAGNPPSAN